MESCIHDDNDLYSPPSPHQPDSHVHVAESTADQRLHDPPTPPAPPPSTAARSSARDTTTTTMTHSSASTTLSTIATSSHAYNMIHANPKDVAVQSVRHAQHARPRATLLNLVSDMSTSSALPQPFGFSMSRKGRMIAIYSTSNIWLVHANKLPRLVMRTLEVRRKPVAVDMLDDGSLLAVLSHPHKADLYTMQSGGNTGPMRCKSIILAVEAIVISLSPDGLVLATGHQYGIELILLTEKASETNRRSVNCDPMDHLAFSDDGRTLLATTSAKQPRATTVFTVHGSFDGPVTDDGDLIPQESHVAWARQILFPEKAVTAKQALLLPDMMTGQVNELFAFDAEDDCWGIYDLAGARFVEAKEPPPDADRSMRAECLEDALPTVSPSADHVAVAVKLQESNAIWLYRLPDAYEPSAAVYGNSKQHSVHHAPVAPCGHVSLQRPQGASAQDITAMRWLSPSTEVADGTGRLLAVGNVVWNTTLDTPLMPRATAKTTGTLIILDFDFSHSTDSYDYPDDTKRIDINLDETLPGEVLPEDDIDFEREVELVRTRTVAQRRAEAARIAARSSLLRSSTTANPTSTTHSRVPGPTSTSARVLESSAFFEEPYSLDQPRSQLSLNRAATVAAIAPANRRHLRALPNLPLEYRRADGLREMPHESDADGWIAPPPPYTENADPPGPGATSISLSHPLGLGLSPNVQSLSAQHTSLPRLHIPASAQSTTACTSMHSAPPARQRPESSSTFEPRLRNHSRSAHPFQQLSSASPTQLVTSLLPTRSSFALPHPSATPNLSSHHEVSAYQATAAYGFDSQSRQPNSAPSGPSPRLFQLAAFHRGSVSTFRYVNTPWDTVGFNRHAAQSAEDLGRMGRRNGGSGSGAGSRGRPNVWRMPTIRSINSYNSPTGVARRANSTPSLNEATAREREGYEPDRTKEGMRRLRCVVM